MMCQILQSTILLLCFAVLLVKASQHSMLLNGHRHLMDFMVQTRDVQRQNPERSLNCFGYYVPILNGITEEYEKEYAQCLEIGSVAREQVDNSTQPQRDDIESTAEAACYVLADCTKLASSIAYFECFANAGSENTKVMYGISANASENLMTVRETYRLIDNKQYACTNASERAYVENTASTYEEMQSCLSGQSAVPSTTESTTTSDQSTTPVYTTTSEYITSETSSTTVESESQNQKQNQNRNQNPNKDTKFRHILSGKLGAHFH